VSVGLNSAFIVDARFSASLRLENVSRLSLAVWHRYLIGFCSFYGNDFNFRPTGSAGVRARSDSAIRQTLDKQTASRFLFSRTEQPKVSLQQLITAG
jgi:hypothetical protein